MKCPKCNGELKVSRTRYYPGVDAAAADRNYLDIDMTCNIDTTHKFWCRIHPKDLEEN